MKHIFFCIIAGCAQLCAVESQTQTVHVIPQQTASPTQKHDMGNHIKDVVLLCKELITLRQFIGASVFICAAMLRYMLNAKAEQRELQKTNQKLEEVEKRTLEHNASLGSLLQMHNKLSILLTDMQDKVGTIENKTEDLQCGVIDLQNHTVSLGKNTKSLNEKTTAMKQVVEDICVQTMSVQTDLSSAKESLAQSLLQILALKEIDEAQKILLNNLHETLKKNEVDRGNLQTDITLLHEEHGKSQSYIKTIEEKLSQTNTKLENTVAAGEVLDTKLTTQYDKICGDNQKLGGELTGIQGTLVDIYQTIQTTSGQFKK